MRRPAQCQTGDLLDDDIVINRERANSHNLLPRNAEVSVCHPRGRSADAGVEKKVDPNESG